MPEPGTMSTGGEPTTHSLPSLCRTQIGPPTDRQPVRCAARPADRHVRPRRPHQPPSARTRIPDMHTGAAGGSFISVSTSRIGCLINPPIGLSRPGRGAGQRIELPGCYHERLPSADRRTAAAGGGRRDPHEHRACRENDSKHPQHAGSD